MLLTAFSPVRAEEKPNLDFNESAHAINELIKDEEINIVEELKLSFELELSKTTDAEQILILNKHINELNNSINLVNNISNKAFAPYNLTCNPYYLMKASIIAYFNNKEYILATELLNYAFANSSTSTIYHPILANIQQVYATS